MADIIHLADASRTYTEFSVPWDGASVNVYAQREHGSIRVRHERVALWGSALRQTDAGQMQLSLRPSELVGLHPDCLQVAVAREVWARIGLPALAASEPCVVMLPNRKASPSRSRR